MTLTASQMMMGSEDITYYASSNGTTTTETTTNIGTATVTGNGSYTCDYTLTIDDNENSLYDAFQSMSTKSTGQIILTVNGEEYDFHTTNLFPKTISGTMSGLTSSKSQNITAQLKLVNKVNVDQSTLANKTLTLTFTATNFKCTAEEESANQGVSYVLATASSEDIWESTLEDDGTRFVGTNPDNYVCFGYDDAETDCDFTNATNSDLYAYRIIGVFEDESGAQHLKLIKKEALNSTYQWHYDYSIETDWEESSLYNGLNGNSFLNNTTYSYMQDSNWLDKIVIWKNINAKISLMNLNDYLLSLGNVALDYNPYNDGSKLKMGWLHISNNDSEASGDEWTSSSSFDGEVTTAAIIRVDGSTDYWIVSDGYLVRPVFYLTSDVTITGEGSIANPFIVS